MIVGPLYGGLPGEQEMQRAAQAVNVGPVIDRRRIDRLLGRHIVGGANRSAGHRDIRASGRSVSAVIEPGQPQIGHFHHSAFVEQQIVRLDVAMNDPLRMGIGQTSRGLQNAIHGARQREWLPPARRTPPDRGR